MIAREGQKVQRLALLSLVYKFLRLAPQYAIPIYFVYSADSGENFLMLAISALVGIVILPSILLGHYYFTYKFAEHDLIINSGVVARKQRNIPYSRIQNINIQQNILHRLLGLAQVKVETAGDSETEGILDAVTSSGAKRIKQKLESLRTNSNNSEKNIPKDIEINIPDENLEIPEKLRFSLNIKDLIKYGMMRFRPVAFLAIAWIFSIGQQFMFFDNKAYDKFGNDLEDYISNQSVSLNLGEYTFWIIIIILLMLIFSWLFDILLTINQFYKFKMEESKGKLNTEYGFLTKHSASIPLKKLQLITVFTNFFRERFGFYGFSIQTAGFGAGGRKKPEVAVPFASRERIVELAMKVLPFSWPEQFENVSKKHIRRFFIRQMISLCFLLGIAFGFIQKWEIFYFLTLLIPMFYYSYLRWKNLAYYFSVENIIVKKGVFFRKMNVMPISKLQTLHISRSVFQRILGLSSIYVDSAAATGSGDVTIPDIPFEMAGDLMRKISKSFHND
jgi:putative membrane protein